MASGPSEGRSRELRPPGVQIVALAGRSEKGADLLDEDAFPSHAPPETVVAQGSGASGADAIQDFLAAVGQHPLEPVEKDLGGFSVRRLLPAAEVSAVGPFVFFDHLGPAWFEACEVVARYDISQT